MATPTVASSTTQAFTGATSTVVCTKPTGLAVGDVLFAFSFQQLAGATITVTPPAGWTVISSVSTGRLAFQAHLVCWKVADASDVAASNFTVFTSNRGGVCGGILCRVTGIVSGVEVEVSEVDTADTAVTTFSFTSALTPRATNTLAIACLLGFDGSIASVATIDSYTSTPTLTWTEVADIGWRDGLSDGGSISLAYANHTTTTQITAYGATFSLSMFSRDGILTLLNGDVSATAQISHLDSLATPIGLEGINTATAQISHIDTTPILYGLESQESSDNTQWINEATNPTTWVNEPL